jgi:hypothetical protein
VRLTLSRVDVVFNAMAGGALRDSAEVAVTAQSGATVSGLTATVDYGRGMRGEWLTIELDQATLPARLSLRANSSSLAPGEYTATVRLAAPGAMPETLSVIARVTTGPGIGLNATRICFTPTYTGPDARPDDVRITSLDGSPIDGLSTTVTYDGVPPFEWLDRPNLTATSAPARLWLSSHKAAMPPGTYHATVQVSSTTPGVAPVSIRVTLDIRPLPSSTLKLTLATVGLGGAGNGRLTAPGIDCVLTNGVQGGDCEESYAPGTVVHVTVIPAAGQVFYFDGCPFMATCTPTAIDLPMNEQQVTFAGGFGAPASTIDVSIRWEGPENGGVGFVEGPHGLRCVGGGCSAMLDGGVGDFPIVAFAEFGGRFLRWEGACTGDIGSCTVHFDTPGTTKNVTAVFHSAPSFVNFLLRGDGASGSVTVSPTLTGTGGTPFVCTLVQGVAQPGCSGTFDPGGGTVTLTAIPAPGSRFAGWDVTLSDDYGVPPTPRCADPLSTTCVLTFVHGNGLIDGYVNFAPQ